MTKILRPLVAGTAVVAVLSLTVACSSAASEGGSAPLRVATIANSPTSLVQGVALQAGIYKEHGIDVELVNSPSGPGIAALVTSGGADIGDIAGPTVVTMASGATPMKFLSDAESANSELIGLEAVKGPNFDKPYPQNILDLKGKRIGVPARGSAIEGGVTAMLRDAGLDPDTDVTWVATGSVATTVAAMTNSQIDFTLWPTSITRTAFVSHLDIYVLGSTDKGTVGSDVDDLLSGSSVVMETTTESRGEDLQKYCTAMAATTTWMQDPANKDELAKISQEWLGLDSVELGLTAGEAVAKTSIAQMTEQQWNDNESIFSDLGHASFQDSIYSPCFTS